MTWKINICFSLKGHRVKLKMCCILYEVREKNAHPFPSDPSEALAYGLMRPSGLKWAWLFQMKTFSPWNLLPLTLAVSSVTLLNWRLFRRLKWAAGDVEIMPVSDLDWGPCQVCASVIFSLQWMCREPEVAYDILFLLWLHITFAAAGKAGRSPWVCWVHVLFFFSSPQLRGCNVNEWQ